MHHSYLAEVMRPAALGSRSRIVQAVCSPIRNPMPRPVRALIPVFARSLVRPMHRVAADSTRVPDVVYPWTVTHGPWFDNNLAICRVGDSALELSWVTGVVEDDHARPRLQQVSAIRLEPLPAVPPRPSGVGSVAETGAA